MTTTEQPESPNTTNGETQEASETNTTTVASTTTQKPSSNPKSTVQELPPKDDEGLLLKYDVIICGTGLVQSILASALTRAGKTVLHCDGNDHYGELDTVWTLDYLQELLASRQQKNKDRNCIKDEGTKNKIFLAKDGANQSLQFHSSGRQTVFPVTEIGTEVQTPYGQGRVVDKTVPSSSSDEASDKENTMNEEDAKTYGSLAVSLKNWTMADGTSPVVYIGVSSDQLSSMEISPKTPSSPDEAMEHHFQKSIATTTDKKPKDTNTITSMRSLSAQHILERQSRSLALDVTPCLLYASGIAVQGFLTSGVAEHLEFQTMQAVYWLQQTNSAKGTKKAALLERVPCSKGDVFQSSLLPPLDKRRFMKFFQLAMDYATERELTRAEAEQPLVETDDYETTEENNSTTNSNTEEGVQSLNERQLNQGRSLARPQNKAVSQKDLQTLYDCMKKHMDFETYLSSHAKLSPQLRQLIRHSLALEIDGREGAVGSSLSTQEGMGRLCDHLKALGQYGTTAFLAPLYGSGEMSQFFCRSAAVYGATYLLRRIPSAVILTTNDDDDDAPAKQQQQQQQRVQGVVVRSCDEDEEVELGGPPSQGIPKEKNIEASHVVFAQEARLSAPTQRRLLRRISVLRGFIVPSVSRFVIVIPPRGVGDHQYAIHGLVLDESARVAPSGCSILHLTTVIDQVEAATAGEDSTGDVLQKALESILESSASTSGESADEIFHTTFSYDLHDEQSDSSTSSTSNVKGLHVINRPPMQMVADDSFEQAQRIFKGICGPNEEFLAISQQMEEKLREHLQDAYRGPNHAEDDTEQVVLDSAMEMLTS